RLMHDPTEGGIATALEELAAAAGATLRIDLGAIPIYEETRIVCAALSLDPLGLLASGALLAVVSAADATRIDMNDDERVGRWRTIGRVERGDAKVILGGEDPAVPFPAFARDEL